MKAVIVCESLFGNTEVLAAFVRKGMQAAGVDVDFVEVGHAMDEPPDLTRYDLLVVAAPTHALSLSRPESRAEAVGRGADPSRERVGVQEWLGSFTSALPDPAPAVAVFDTRVAKTRHWPGSAARRAARWLRKDGFTVCAVESFYVEGIAGPLSPGEVVRAEQWGSELGGSMPRDAESDGAGNHCG